MFEQLSQRLRRTCKNLTGKGRLTEANIADAMREVRVALLEADVALPVARDFIARVKKESLGREVLDGLSPGQAVIKIVHDALAELMGASHAELNLAARPPAVILLAGLQGAGKTTTAGKLAAHLRAQHTKRILLASVDIYRPAAIEQLRQLADAASAKFYATEADARGAPAQIAADALNAARTQGMDVLILDTAGRLHVDAEMMDEIREIHAAVNPIETLFVVDGMSGQDAVNSARAFDETLPLSGVVLTKTDGDARGGAALSMRAVTGKPIKFIGVGESLDALQAFHPERAASRMLGMGDVLSLVEEVERKVDARESKQLAEKIARGKFDLEDFRAQLLQMESMGGVSALLEKLPGADQIPAKAAQLGGARPAMSIAIINSMTPHERQFPAVLKGSRKKRIASGSGARVQDVNQLLKQFMQAQKMMQRMKKRGGMQKMLRQLQRG